MKALALGQGLLRCGCPNGLVLLHFGYLSECPRCGATWVVYAEMLAMMTEPPGTPDYLHRAGGYVVVFTNHDSGPLCDAQVAGPRETTDLVPFVA